MRRRTRELLNNVAEIVLTNVVNLRLRLLPSRIVVKVWLVQWTLPYVLPHFIHTQMIIKPIFRVIHFDKTSTELRNTTTKNTTFYLLQANSHHSEPSKTVSPNTQKLKFGNHQQLESEYNIPIIKVSPNTQKVKPFFQSQATPVRKNDQKEHNPKENPRNATTSNKS